MQNTYSSIVIFFGKLWYGISHWLGYHLIFPGNV